MECAEELATLSICSCASRLKLLRSLVRDAASLAGLGDDDVDAVVLSVNEACTNIMQHAYRMDPGGRIEVTLLDDGDALVVRLRDYAEPVDPAAVYVRDLEELRPGGLGLHLISSLMDEYGFLDPPAGGGNLFQMKKYTARDRGRS